MNDPTVEFLDNLINATQLGKLDWVYDCSEVSGSFYIYWYDCFLEDFGNLSIGLSSGGTLHTRGGGVSGGSEIIFRVSDLHSAIKSYLKRNEPVPYAEQNAALKRLIES